MHESRAPLSITLCTCQLSGIPHFLLQNSSYSKIQILDPKPIVLFWRELEGNNDLQHFGFIWAWKKNQKLCSTSVQGIPWISRCKKWLWKKQIVQLAWEVWIFHCKIWLLGRSMPYLLWQNTLKVMQPRELGGVEGEQWTQSLLQLWSQGQSILLWVLLAVSSCDCTFCATWGLNSKIAVALDQYETKELGGVFKVSILGSVSARCHPVLTAVGLQHSKPEMSARWMWVGGGGTPQPMSHCWVEQEVNLLCTRAGVFFKKEAARIMEGEGKVGTATNFPVPCGPECFPSLEVILQAGRKNSAETVQVMLITVLLSIFQSNGFWPYLTF